MRRKRTFSWPVVALSACIMVAVSATTAAAHTTTVTKADPAAGSTVAQSPAQVMVQFSEEVVSQGSTLKVLDASGKQVGQDGRLDLNDPNHQIMLAALPAALADGVYTVQYHVVLTDGDATDGSYQFTVQSGAAPAAATASSAQPAATTEPAAATTVVPTLAAPAVTTGTPAGAVSAPAQGTPPATVTPAVAPGTLPATGAGSGVALAWPLATLGVILLALGFTALRRRVR